MDLIFSILTETSGTASFLILGVLLARFLLKNSPKYIRKILWLLVGLRLIFPFSVESTFSILPTKKEKGCKGKLIFLASSYFYLPSSNVLS
jgi:beta-lactamase regulating signal transducer with metallopeptidase domain